jgi:phenylpropionate dioxygenase-like ring-hydroxylating dioxygenase large terminal subunit
MARDTDDQPSSRVLDLVEAAGEITETGRLPKRIHNDPDVHRLELERVFGEQWVLVGHETELPEPGDYAKRYVGDSPFIFVRDEHGDLRVLFDSCRHRGTTVVRAEQGNTTHFRCPYHNWTYKNTGELVGVPRKAESFAELDTCEHSLRPAPQVDTYAGLVFASLSADAPPLAEYLGEFTWYLDLLFKSVEGGMEVVGEPIRWEVDTNWKIGADNFTGDSYHTPATHMSVLDLDIFPPELSGERPNRSGVDVTDCGGHSGLVAYFEGERAPGYPESLYTDEHVSDEQFRLARELIDFVGTVFPNCSILQAPFTPDPGNREIANFLNVRKWRPLGPAETEVWNWILVPSGASEEFKQRAYDTGISTFSVAGNFEVDDFAVWDGIAEAAGSTFAKRIDPKGNYQMGMDGMGGSEDISDEWPGPGTVYGTNFEDGTLRTFYDSWHKAMTGQQVG